MPEILFILPIELALSLALALATRAQRNSHHMSDPRKTPSTIIRVLSRAACNSLTPIAAKTATKDMMVIGLRNVRMSVLKNADRRFEAFEKRDVFDVSAESDVSDSPSSGLDLKVSDPILNSRSAAKIFISVACGLINASAEVIETAAIKP